MLFESTPHAYVCSAPDLAMEVLERLWYTGAVIVAVGDDDRPVGFAVAHELDGEGYLQEVDVDPAYGRRGLGTKLVEAVIAWASERGFATVVLRTFADIAWNAPYYARLGFKYVADNDATPAMHAIRDEERRAGLRVESRVFMRLRMR